MTLDYVTRKAAELLMEDLHPTTMPAFFALGHLPDLPPSPGQVVAMSVVFGCPATPLLILVGWLPKLDTSLPVASPRRWRQATLYQRVGEPGWGVYDDTNADEVAALRLRFILTDEPFPAKALWSAV